MVHGAVFGSFGGSFDFKTENRTDVGILSRVIVLVSVARLHDFARFIFGAKVETFFVSK
jgi:hypothetical protein